MGPHAKCQAGLAAGSGSSPYALRAMSTWPFWVRIKMRRYKGRSTCEGTNNAVKGLVESPPEVEESSTHSTCSIVVW